MSTLGETLQESREAKGVTSSEAAAATRIKIQHIHDMEKDDFSHIPAPTYAKGFIKLYAEYLKLDPAPLIQEYMREHHPKKSTSVLAEEKGLDEVKKYSTKDLFKASWPPFNASIKKWGYVGGGVVLFLLFISVTRCGSSKEKETTSSQNNNVPVGGLIQEPPEPYLDLSP